MYIENNKGPPGPTLKKETFIIFIFFRFEEEKSKKTSQSGLESSFTLTGKKQTNFIFKDITIFTILKKIIRYILFLYFTYFIIIKNRLNNCSVIIMAMSLLFSCAILKSKLLCFVMYSSTS